MRQNEENKQSRQPDRHLDIPSEANRDKHINFEKIEEGNGQLIEFKDKDAFKERQKQWQQGIEEGKKESENTPHRE